MSELALDQSSRVYVKNVEMMWIMIYFFWRFCFFKPICRRAKHSEIRYSAARSGALISCFPRIGERAAREEDQILILLCQLFNRFSTAILFQT